MTIEEIGQRLYNLEQLVRRHTHDKVETENLTTDSLSDYTAPTASSGWTSMATGTFSGDTTISGLTGDTNTLYMLVIREYNATSTIDCALRFNGETGNNYRYFRHIAANEGGGGNTTSISTSTSDSSIKLNRYSQNHLFINAIINAKQGTNRFVNFQTTGYEDTSNYETTTGGGIYTDGSAELTSITIYHLGGANPTEGFYWLFALQP